MRKNHDHNIYSDEIPSPVLLTSNQVVWKKKLSHYTSLLESLDEEQWKHTNLPPREIIEGEVKILLMYKQMYYAGNKQASVKNIID